ncbi:hypothetical protein SAMN05421823_11732 [Catalinimonas alkaloidigena]|uniref:Cadherin domain-containing protein n=1 Tax=Catalinimonas alkaloidigena TaxID=1075417 RepID=A0A1G9UP79_9BACT|nr:hypothetical protein [Catalinimonas alkaloidigena]SDM61738.1 hypothetical protein SAMN05421823_11732 [Catalinimonas alkaloidigena]
MRKWILSLILGGMLPACGLWAQTQEPEILPDTLSASTPPPADSAHDTPPTPELDLLLPELEPVAEGETLSFDVKAQGQAPYTFRLVEGTQPGVQLDSAGHFTWTPGYDLVGRLEEEKAFPLLFEVRNANDEKVVKKAEIVVKHTNRSPVAGELKPFYVQYNTQNTYQIEAGTVYDEDEDPIVFVPIPTKMPEGMKLSAQGEVSWRPSITQFNALKREPIEMEFYVEDQPAKARTQGTLKLAATQMDLPPSISVAPKSTRVSSKEDVTINLKFYLSDPNGDDDIQAFDFVTNQPNFPKDALVRNTDNQYEFIWTPNYDFVQDPLDSLTFEATFFALDKSRKREELTIEFTIQNAVNEEALDRKLYTDYRTMLVRTWEMLEQLQEVEERLKKDFRTAKRGKKNRSIANASLGAVTGVTPVIESIPDPTKKVVSTIGGTTVMTMGTLEATEVIGKSTKDLLDRLNYVIEKRNDLQARGDAFARKYALRSSRRWADFAKDRDDLRSALSLKGVVALELDAGWTTKKKATDKQLSQTFKDFAPEEWESR